MVQSAEALATYSKPLTKYPGSVSGSIDLASKVAIGPPTHLRGLLDYPGSTKFDEGSHEYLQKLFELQLFRKKSLVLLSSSCRAALSGVYSHDSTCVSGALILKEALSKATRITSSSPPRSDATSECRDPMLWSTI